jgi:hypothetical protein
MRMTGRLAETIRAARADGSVAGLVDASSL